MNQGDGWGGQSVSIRGRRRGRKGPSSTHVGRKWGGVGAGGIGRRDQSGRGKINEKEASERRFRASEGLDWGRKKGATIKERKKRGRSRKRP